MKKKKTYLAAIVLLLLFVVGGAIAYFTDTDTKTNVFTIGSVDIELIESAWDALTDANGNDIPDDAEGMMPGETVTKDPVIRNKSEKSPAYVFATVEIPCSTVVETVAPTALPLFTYTLNSGWAELTNDHFPIGCTSGGTAKHVYFYGTAAVADPATPAALTILAQATNSTTPTPTSTAIFSSITLNTQLTGKEAGLTGNKEVVVTAYGIQTEGLGNDVSPATVWANFGVNS